MLLSCYAGHVDTQYTPGLRILLRLTSLVTFCAHPHLQGLRRMLGRDRATTFHSERQCLWCFLIGVVVGYNLYFHEFSNVQLTMNPRLPCVGERLMKTQFHNFPLWCYLETFLAMIRRSDQLFMAFIVAMRISLISWLSLSLSSSQQHRTEAVKEEHASRWKSIVTCRELHFGLVLIRPYLKQQQLLERALQPLATYYARGRATGIHWMHPFLCFMSRIKQVQIESFFTVLSMQVMNNGTLIWYIVEHHPNHCRVRNFTLVRSLSSVKLLSLIPEVYW